MISNTEAVKEPLKLKRGTAVKIAKRGERVRPEKKPWSVTHVDLCIKGERTPSDELAREIERERQKQKVA